MCHLSPPGPLVASDHILARLVFPFSPTPPAAAAAATTGSGNQRADGDSDSDAEIDVISGAARALALAATAAVAPPADPAAGGMTAGRAMHATVSERGDALRMMLPACSVLEPSLLIPMAASKVAGVLLLQVALDGQHFEVGRPLLCDMARKNCLFLI